MLYGIRFAKVAAVLPFRIRINRVVFRDLELMPIWRLIFRQISKVHSFLAQRRRRYVRIKASDATDLINAKRRNFVVKKKIGFVYLSVANVDSHGVTLRLRRMNKKVGRYAIEGEGFSGLPP